MVYSWVYKLSLAIIMFSNQINCSDRPTGPQHLSDIISEYYGRLDSLIKETKLQSRPVRVKQLDHDQNIAARVQKLAACQQRLLNAWRANDLDQLLIYLPEDLKKDALTAKHDFATPVLDTRALEERP